LRRPSDRETSAELDMKTLVVSAGPARKPPEVSAPRLAAGHGGVRDSQSAAGGATM